MSPNGPSGPRSSSRASSFVGCAERRGAGRLRPPGDLTVFEEVGVARVCEGDSVESVSVVEGGASCLSGSGMRLALCILLARPGTSGGAKGQSCRTRRSKCSLPSQGDSGSSSRFMALVDKRACTKLWLHTELWRLKPTLARANARPDHSTSCGLTEAARSGAAASNAREITWSNCYFEFIFLS